MIAFRSNVINPPWCVVRSIALQHRARVSASSGVRARVSASSKLQNGDFALDARHLSKDSKRFASSGDSASDIPDLKLLELRAKLDGQIVGHDDMKECVLLGLLAKEHIYIEGPPGVGKTQLAEAAASEAGLAPFFYQFHRDTRIHELIGDATILREQTPQGEVIRQGVYPGGILKAQICILDDISRAPGEALNVLLRMLNERKFAGTQMQLRCAVATGNPPREEFFNEPLDPAILDRFTLQISVSGHVKSADWSTCKTVVQQHALKTPPATNAASDLSAWADEWSAYDQKLSEVVFPDEILTLLLEVLDTLVKEHGLGNENPALLTDRTFLIKAPRLMQANALLNGRCKCDSDDLFVLRFLTRFRIPESVHQKICEIIQSVIDRQKQKDEPRSGGQGGASEGAPNKPSEKEPESQPQPKSHSSGQKDASLDADGKNMNPIIQTILKYLKYFLGDLKGHQIPLINDKSVHIEGAEALLKALHGSLQRSNADLWQRPGGLPRRWRAMRRIDEADDSDPAELSMWCSSPSPMLPRTAHRQRVERGGALAILRDVSDSMSRPQQEYMLARCASLTTCTIVDLARRNRMCVGYSEFGDDSWKHFTRDSGARFFTRDYIGIQGLARKLETRGGTFYQRAIRDVLSEFERLAQIAGLGQRMHAVVLSDGEPTIGCAELHEERQWAQRLRVCIHTIFIGEGAYPPVLARLAVDTGGKRFQAIPRYEAASIRITDVSHLPVIEPPLWRKWVSGARAR